MKIIKFIKFISYIIPFFGNNQIIPYGKMVVELNGIRKTVRFGYKDKIDSEGGTFITFNRHRYYFTNKGSLYNPKFVF